MDNMNVQHRLFYGSQYGFREDPSTEYAAIELVDRIYEHHDIGDTSVAIFLDLSKAFDMLDHDILLCKLSKFGINNNELQWFKSYLSDRTQYVEFNGKKASILPITKGAPQGSILGPLLFIIYINSMSNLNIASEIKLYADDTLLVHSENTVEELNVVLQRDLDVVARWCNENSLTVNINNHQDLSNQSYL